MGACPRPAPSPASPPPPPSARWGSSASWPTTRARRWARSWRPASCSPPPCCGSGWRAPRGDARPARAVPPRRRPRPRARRHRLRRSRPAATSRRSTGSTPPCSRCSSTPIPSWSPWPRWRSGASGPSRRTAVVLAVASIGLVLVLAGAAAGALDPLGAALGLGAAIVYSVYILVSERVAARVAPLALSTLVCTGAAASLTLGSLAVGDLRAGRRERRRLRVARRPRPRLDRRGDRAVRRRPAARRPVRGRDPVDARAGDHRRAGLPRLRRVAGSRAVRRAARSCCSRCSPCGRPPRARSSRAAPTVGGCAPPRGDRARGSGREPQQPPPPGPAPARRRRRSSGRLAARRAVRLDVGDAAARAVAVEDRRPGVARGPAIAPGDHRHQHVDELEPLRVSTYSWRGGRSEYGRRSSIPASTRCLSRSASTLREMPRPRWRSSNRFDAHVDVAEHERRPRLAGDGEAARDRARHRGEVGSLHDARGYLRSLKEPDSATFLEGTYSRAARRRRWSCHRS